MFDQVNVQMTMTMTTKTMMMMTTMNATDPFPATTLLSAADTGSGVNGSGNSNLIMFILWVIVLPVIATLGLIGNILTMVVLWRKEMHSTTILYLRALVVTDTGILIGSVIFLTPISCANYLSGPYLDHFRNEVYPILHTPGYYLVMALQQCNVWITVSVSMERYIAICHPFRAARFITRRKTIIVIVAIVLISLIYNTPHLFATYAADCSTGDYSKNDTNISNHGYSSIYNNDYNHTNNTTSVEKSAVSPFSSFFQTTPVPDDNDYNVITTFSSSSSDRVPQSHAETTEPQAPQTCLIVMETEFGKSMFYIRFRTILYAAIIHFIPLLALVILNSFLIKELMVMQRKRSGTNINDENEANLSLVLVLIVIVFILCQTPGLISQFEIQPTSAFHIWLAVANLLFATNSAVNFLIYTAFGRKFRKVLLRIFRRIYNGGRKPSHCSYRTWQYTNNECEMSTIGDVNSPHTKRPSATGHQDNYCNGHKNECKPLYETNHTNHKQIMICDKGTKNGTAKVNVV